MTLDERFKLFMDANFTTDTRIELESGGQGAIGTAKDLIKLAWSEALQADQDLNGDL